jgi:hypothetical protein
MIATRVAMIHTRMIEALMAMFDADDRDAYCNRVLSFRFLLLPRNPAAPPHAHAAAIDRSVCAPALCSFFSYAGNLQFRHMRKLTTCVGVYVCVCVCVFVVYVCSMCESVCNLQFRRMRTLQFAQVHGVLRPQLEQKGTLARLESL